MKTRDKVKYAFATLLALGTCAAIAIMVVAQHRREHISEEDQMQIRQTLSTFGAPPSATPPAPLAVQHGATQVDPATRP